MSIEENKAIVRRLFTKFTGPEVHLKLADEHMDPNYVRHWQDGSEWRGLDMWREIWRGFYAVFPEFEFIIEDIVAEGDKVAVRYTGRGVQQGEFLGVTAMNRPMIVKGYLIYRLAGGKLMEDWGQAAWAEDLEVDSVC